MLLARLHFITLEEGRTAGEGMRGRDKVSQQMSSREGRRERRRRMRVWSIVGRSKLLVMHISLSFLPIWAKCGLACYCLRHAGRWGCVCAGPWGGGGSRARHLSRKFLKKLNVHRNALISLHYWISSEKLHITADLETARIPFFAAHTSNAFPSPPKGAGGSCSAPSLPLTLWQTEPAAPAHTTASNISNALGGKAMWSCPSLPAPQHIMHSTPVMITLSSLSSVMHSLPAGGWKQIWLCLLRKKAASLRDHTLIRDLPWNLKHHTTFLHFTDSEV